MAKILITGGAGFIGSNLALELNSRGHEVTVLDNLSEQIHGNEPEKKSKLFLNIKDKVTFIKGSVTDIDTCRVALENQTILVHFAAETGTGQSMYEIEKYCNVNIIGTANLLQIIANEENSIEKVIIASSRSIYGEGAYENETGEKQYPKHRSLKDMENGNYDVYDNYNKKLKPIATDEESKIHPSSVYGVTKQCQEQLIMTVCTTLGIACTSLRYQNVYGPGQSLKNPYTGILSIFSTLIKNNQEINVFEDGKESRDFVYIDDVIDATIKSIEMDEANGQIFNVGSGKPTDVITVAKELIKSFKSEVSYSVSGNFRLGDIRHNYADLKKINNYLGFTPKFSFVEGIKKFTKWVDEQEIEETKFQKSMEEMKNKGMLK